MEAEACLYHSYNLEVLFLHGNMLPNADFYIAPKSAEITYNLVKETGAQRDERPGEVGGARTHLKPGELPSV